MSDQRTKARLAVSDYKPGDGNVLRAVRVAVPSGMYYRGQIRDVRWD